MKLVLRCVVAILLATAVIEAVAQRPETTRCPALQALEDMQFHPGDVWTYATRPGEAGSTLTILKVEQSAKIGVIVHVRATGLHLLRSDGVVLGTIEHMPFTRAALAASVTRKIGAGVVPEFGDGYSSWASACGGAYTISVSEAVAVAEKTLQRGTMTD